MIRVIFLLLLSLNVSAQSVVWRSPPIAEWQLDNGRVLIGWFDGSSTVGNGIDTIPYLAGRVVGCDLSNITQYYLYTEPISVTSTSTVNCKNLITDINASAAAGNVTITLNPLYNKQVINVKRTDNTNNTLRIQMASGNIELQPYKDFENVQNMNYQLRWDSSTNTTSIR